MTTDITIRQPDENKLSSGSSDLQNKSLAIVIKDQGTYDQAGELYKLAQTMEKQVIAEFKEPKEAAHKAHKSFCALEKKILIKIQDPMGILARKRIDYENEQARLRAEEQKKQEEKRKQIIEEERLKYATDLDNAGKKKEAEQVLDAPVIIEPVVVEKKVEKTEGLTTVTTWKGKVTNPVLFIQTVARIPSLHNLLEINEGQLNKMASKLKDTFNLDGATAYEEQTMRKTSGKKK